MLPDDDPTNLEAISAWMGDVVEVAETEGYLYVVVNDPQSRPRVGSFYVRPFESALSELMDYVRRPTP